MGRKNNNGSNRQLTDFSHLINKVDEVKDTKETRRTEEVSEKICVSASD